MQIFSSQKTSLLLHSSTPSVTMMSCKKIIAIFCILIFCKLPLYAQEKESADSVAKKTADSSQLAAEKYIFQQKEQQRIDSIVAVQLQTELQKTSNDSKRKKYLEDSLQKLLQKDSLRRQEQLQKIKELKQHATGYPVRLVTDTLFYIYTRLGSFSASDRANAIEKRIRKLYEDAFFNADSITVIQNETSYDIVYNNEAIIMSVTDLDALWFNESSSQLANEYIKKIQAGVVKQKDENSLVNLLKRVGYVLLILAGICLIIYIFNHLFRKLTKRLIAEKNKHFKGFCVRKVQILSAEQHYKAAMQVNNIIRIVIIILAIYVALPLFFSVFPQTKPFADVLWNWIITPAKILFNDVIHFLPNFFTIIVIYFATTYLVKAIKYFAAGISNETIHITGFYKDWATPTFNIVRFVIYAFMVVIVYPYIPGSKSDAFKGVSVFLGILVSLGSSSAISNIVAGLVITYMRPYKVGDRVKIGEVVGDVVEKTMLVTRVRTIKNEDITVPNSTILNSYTINYSANAKDTGLIVHTTITIGYDAPWKDVQQALIDAALKTEFVIPQPIPFVLQTSLDDFFVSYQINVYTREANKQAAIYSSLHQNIQDVFNERGIEIMSPHYNAVRDGNANTIPPDYLPKDYKAPKFNVNINKDDAK